MIPLTAREALSPQVERVTATMRPSELEERKRGSGLCAVFGEEDEAFLGLVAEHASASFPNRIFADLLDGPRPAPVAAETPIEAIYHRMAAEGVEAFPVLDENGAFLGVITWPSLLETLLRREREFLAEAQRLQGQLEAEQKHLVAWSKRQEELNEASRALLGLVGQTTLERELLQQAIQALATIVQARYGAIGILDEASGLQQFHFAGLTPEEVDRIGEHPRGRGLLGVVIRECEILRLEDLTQDPRHAGFPPYHAPMKALLAVPISHQGAVYGRVYLCDKTTGEPFTEDDERLTLSLTRSLALALAHSRELAERKRAEDALRESEDRYRDLVEHSRDLICTHDLEGNILSVNQQAGTVLGCDPNELLMKNVRDLLVPEVRDEFDAYLARIRSDGAASGLMQVQTSLGERRVWEYNNTLRTEGVAAPIVRGVARDITERMRAEMRLAGEKHILELVAKGAPLDEVLGGLARNIEKESLGLLCSILLLDPHGVTLRHGAAPSLPESYVRAIDGIAIGPSVGSCGTAAYRQELVIVSDIASDPLWAEFRDLGLTHGLRACWSAPIFSARGDLLGTFAVYYREPRAPAQADLERIDRATHIAGIAIERKRAEEALTLFRSLIDHTNDAIEVVDPETGRFLDVNESACQAHGYSREEYLTLSVRDIDPVVGTQPWEEIREEVRRSGSRIYDTQHRRKDGSVFPVEVNCTYIRLDRDYMLAVVRDITERKQAEEALKKGNERFHLVARATNDAVWDWDLLTNQVWWNEGVTALFGYAAEEIGPDATWWYDHIHPEDRERVLSGIHAVIEGDGQVWSDEYRYRCANGSDAFVIDRGYVVRDGAGKPLRMIGCMTDITERKRGEESRQALYRASLAIQEPLGLRDRLDRLLRTAQTVLDLDRVNILLADPEGQWLQAVASTGTVEPLAALRVPLGLAGGGLAQAYHSQQMVVWDGQGSVPEALRLRSPYDQIAAFRSRVFANLPLVIQGRAIGVLGADRKHTRRALEPATLELLQLFASQAAIAIENSRLFEQVQDGRERLRTLSHQLVEIQETERQHIARELHDEIGQALTGLKLSLEMSKHVPPDAIRPRLDEALELVNELMAHARDLSLDLRPAMLDDLGLLPTLLWHFDRYTAQTGIQVTFKHTGLERRFAPQIETAAYRIVQEALTNVARHAGVSEVMVQLWADQDKLEARIEDRGAGFDPRAALATSATSGLAGMRERAVSLGGQLTVESSPGIGTHLTGEFPLGAPIERRERKRDAQDGDRAGG